MLRWVEALGLTTVWIALGFSTAALKFIAAFIAIIVCTNWAKALGGIIYFALTFPLWIPRVSRIYEALTSSVVELSFLFKIVGFVVSSSGPLVLFLLAGALYPSFLQDHALLWGAFMGTTGVSLNIMHRVHTMELPGFREYFPMVKRYLKFDPSKLALFDTMRLARSQFLDMNLIDLLILVVCYGLSLFCVDALWPSAAQPTTTPLEAIGNAFSFLRIPLGTSSSVLSPARIVINTYYGISLVIFTAFFISLTSRMIDEPPPPTEEERVKTGFNAVVETVELARSTTTDKPSA